MSPSSLPGELEAIRATVVTEIGAMHDAREKSLSACRKVIRLCSRSIRMVHREEFADAARVADEAEQELRTAQHALQSHAKVAHAGFLHDAEKEYVEARITARLIEGGSLPDPASLQVETAAWLNGLAEAASELRRYLLNSLRLGRLDDGDRLLDDMDHVYELLVSIDFPDALTGGLRRTTDAYRAVLERTRSDYTVALMQGRLQAALESHAAKA